MAELVTHLQALWCRDAVKSHLIKSMLDELEPIYTGRPSHGDISPSQIRSQAKILTMGVKPKIYKPLMERPVCGKYFDFVIVLNCLNLIAVVFFLLTDTLEEKVSKCNQ